MKTVSLRSVCDVIMGSAPVGESYGELASGMPLIAGAGDFGEDFPSPKKATNQPTQVTCKGDIILCIRATIGDLNWADKQYCLGRGVAALRPHKEQLDPRYLWYWLSRNKNKLSRLARGSTFKQVGRGDIEGMSLDLPRLDEQRRIAAILDKADAIRRKRQQALEAGNSLERNAFLELFGDPVVNPKSWPVKRIGDMLVFLTSGSRGWAQYYSDSGSFFLRIQNVGRDQLNLKEVIRVQAPKNPEAERTRVQAGDVLLSITADLGRVGIVPSALAGAYINQHLAIIRVRPNEIVPDYLSSYLASHAGQAQITRLNRQGVKAGLNFDDIRGLKVLLPPKTTQLKYAAMKAKAQEIRRVHEQAMTQNEILFSALSNRAWSA
ncbi:MAG TPA: hypothetical protein DCM05_16395 [Elusimicrobia bacterium]|nr:hypothetical protein [Elusimicrobiota bacterium]